VVERGDGPPIVFLHSLLADGRMFEAQTDALSVDHRTINVDARAHGRSSIPRRQWSMDEQAHDTLYVMNQLGVDRAVLVGLSMGGMAAMRFAVRHPDRVAGLALFDTAATSEKLLKKIKYKALARIARLIGIRRPLAIIVSRLLFGRTFRRREPDVVETWIRRLMRLNAEGLARATTAVVERSDISSMLGGVDVPTLVVVGDEDVATVPSESRHIADRMPRARLEVLKNVGHLSTIEAPARTTSLLLNWLDEIDW